MLPSCPCYRPLFSIHRATRLGVLMLTLGVASVGTVAQAQTVLRGHLGVSGFTVVGGTNPGERSTFVFPTAGLMVQRRLPGLRTTAVEIGLFYVGKGANSEGTLLDDDGAPVEATTELRLAYLDVPILARLDLPIRPGVSAALQAGLVLEFLLDEGIDIVTGDGTRTGTRATDNIASTSTAWQLGGAVTFERYEIGARYHRSLGDVSGDAADAVFQELRHSGVVVSLSYRL